MIQNNESSDQTSIAVWPFMKNNAIIQYEFRTIYATSKYQLKLSELWIKVNYGNVFDSQNWLGIREQ